MPVGNVQYATNTRHTLVRLHLTLPIYLLVVNHSKQCMHTHQMPKGLPRITGSLEIANHVQLLRGVPHGPSYSIKKQLCCLPHIKQAFTKEAWCKFAKLGKAINTSQHHIKARDKW